MKDFPPGFETDGKNIAVDFDGVVHNFDKGYHDGTCYGDSRFLDALDALRTAIKKNITLLSFTAKAKPSRPLSQWKNRNTASERVACKI